MSVSFDRNMSTVITVVGNERLEDVRLQARHRFRPQSELSPILAVPESWKDVTQLAQGKAVRPPHWVNNNKHSSSFVLLVWRVCYAPNQKNKRGRILSCPAPG